MRFRQQTVPASRHSGIAGINLECPALNYQLRGNLRFIQLIKGPTKCRIRLISNFGDGCDAVRFRGSARCRGDETRIWPGGGVAGGAICRSDARLQQPGRNAGLGPYLAPDRRNSPGANRTTALTYTGDMLAPEE